MRRPSSIARSAVCWKCWCTRPRSRKLGTSSWRSPAHRRDRGIDYWPGFVDALSTLVLGIIFLLTVFVVVQFFLSQDIAGKDTALSPSQRPDRPADRPPVAGEDRQGLARGRDRAAAGQSRRRRERARPPQGRGRERPASRQRRQARGKVDRAHHRARQRKSSISARALAQVEVLNQQIAALRRQLAALEDALDASEKRDREAQTQDRRSRPAPQRRAGAARAGAVALSLRLLRPAARNPRQSRRHPRRRRSLRVPVGSLLRRRPGGARAGRPRRARQARRRAVRPGKADPDRDRLGAARRRPHRRAADRERAVPLELGAVGRARDLGRAVSDQQGRFAAAPGRRRVRRIPAARHRPRPKMPIAAIAASS